MKVTKPIVIITLLCSTLIAGGTPAARRKDPEPTSSPTRFRFSESLRKEIMTQTDFNRRQSQSASMGKVTLDFEVPLKSAAASGFKPATPFLIKAGNLEFRSSLEKDRDYHPGANSATLKLTSMTSGKSLNILATVRLRWDRSKLTGKIEAKTPGALHSVAAEDFLGDLKGKIEGETHVRIEFDSTTAEATIPFRGQLNHIIREGFDITGEVITIHLHGELKKPGTDS